MTRSWRRKPHIGAERSFSSLQLMSTARRFARKDRQLRPVYCDFAGKLMYDTEEIARSTGQALTRIAGFDHYLYHCPRGDHWHLTRDASNNGAPNAKA